MFKIVSLKEYRMLKDEVDLFRNKINELEIKLGSTNANYNEEIVKHINDKKEYDEEIARKDELIGELQMKIDLLHKYYNSDEEPSQEIKTKMRIDERVHDLELENIELRNYIRLLNNKEQDRALCEFNKALAYFNNYRSIANINGQFYIH